MVIQLRRIIKNKSNYEKNGASRAQGIYVFIKTNRFGNKVVPYTGGRAKRFLVPTSDTRELIIAAKEALKEMYSSEHKYKKAGVMLLDLIPEEHKQLNFFANNEREQKSEKLMSVIDRINKLLNKEAVFIASQGTKRFWQMKSTMRSNRFTTSWDELCMVN